MAGRHDVPERAGAMLGVLFRLLILLILVGGVGLVGYAYFGDLEPGQTRVSAPITLELEQGE